MQIPVQTHPSKVGEILLRMDHPAKVIVMRADFPCPSPSASFVEALKKSFPTEEPLLKNHEIRV